LIDEEEPTRPEHSFDLLQRSYFIRYVLQDPTREDSVEAGGGEGQQNRIISYDNLVRGYEQ